MIDPIERRYLTEEVADKLQSLVLSGDYEPGDRLPSIEELSNALNVGKTTVREALRQLESLRLIHIQHGSGIFVSETARLPLLVRPLVAVEDQLEETVLDDLNAVRSILETNASHLAAAHAKPDQVERIGDLLALMEETVDTDPEAFSRHNTAFHLAVSDASGNTILPLLLSAVRELILLHQERLNESHDMRLKSLEFHRQIFEAVRDRKPEQARTAMSEHLKDIQAALDQMRSRQASETSTSG